LYLVLKNKKKEEIIAKRADNNKQNETIKDVSRKAIIESEESYKEILSEHKLPPIESLSTE